jgi:creatinine amidohydrolase/Fe(II)-dependent formamide hydrolase-like protein
MLNSFFVIQQKWRWSKMNVEQLQRSRFGELLPYLDTVILPVGAIAEREDCESFIANLRIVKRLADGVEKSLTGRVLLLPEVVSGPFTAKTVPQLPAEVFADYIYTLLCGFQTWGVKHAVLLNGHEANLAALERVYLRLCQEGWKVLLFHWWKDQDPRQIAELCCGVSATSRTSEQAECFLRETGTRLVADVISLWK